MEHAQSVAGVPDTSDLLVQFYGINAQNVDTSSIRLEETDWRRHKW